MSNQRQYFEITQPPGCSSRKAIEISPSFFTALVDLYDHTDRKKVWIPTQLADKVRQIKTRVIKTFDSRPVLQWIGFGFVVREDLGDVFARELSSNVDCIPIEMSWPKQSEKRESYMFINVHECVDCFHFAKNRVWEGIHNQDPEWLRSGVEYNAPRTLDPSRIPVQKLIFYTRYTLEGPFVEGRIAEIIEKSCPGAFAFRDVHLVGEDDHGRSELLREKQEIARRIMVTELRAQEVDSAAGVEAALKLLLSKRATKHFNAFRELDDADVELFDGARAVEETLRLRKWKELDWPDHLVCISEDGRGGYFALDLSKATDGDCPVVYFDHELADIDKKTGRITPHFEMAAKTFDAWVKRLKRGGSAMPKT